MEERVLDRHGALEMHVLLEGIGRVKVVRRLHECNLRITDEPARRRDEEVVRGDVVAVEDHDVLAARDGHRVVDVARLGMIVLFALDVARTCGLRKGLDEVAAAVVEHIDVELVGGPVHVERGVDRRLDDVERLVVGRDEDVDVGPDGAVGGQRGRLAVEHPADLEVAEHHHGERIDLGHEKQAPEEEVEPVARAHGRRAAPPEVAAGDNERNDEEQHERDPCADAHEHDHGDEHERKEDDLAVQVEGLGDAERGKDESRHKQDDGHPAGKPAAARLFLLAVIDDGAHAPEGRSAEGIARAVDQGAGGAQDVDDRAHEARAVTARRKDSQEKDRLDEDAQGIEKLRSVEVDLRIEERLVAAQRGEWLRLKRRHEPEKTEADDIERRGDAARAGGTPVLVQAADVLERVLYGSRKHSLKTDKGL